MCDIKTPFITDTVGTLSLCPHQLDSVIEGVQSNAPSLLFFSARISLGCLHDLNACWLVTDVYLCLGLGCFPLLSGSPLPPGVRKARVECNLIMLG